MASELWFPYVQVVVLAKQSWILQLVTEYNDKQQ